MSAGRKPFYCAKCGEYRTLDQTLIEVGKTARRKCRECNITVRKNKRYLGP